MKTQKRNLAGFILHISLAFIIALTLNACAKKISFASSDVVPAATGNVKVKKDQNNNYRVEVSLRNLAPSGKLTPPRETYVVWVETASSGVKNIGQINTSTGLFSKTLKADLRSNMPEKPTKVFITAEESQTVQYPGNMVVLSTKSF